MKRARHDMADGSAYATTSGSSQKHKLYSTPVCHEPNDFLRFFPSTAGDGCASACVDTGIGIVVCAGLLAGEGYANEVSPRECPLILAEATPFGGLCAPLVALVPFGRGRGMELGGGPEAKDVTWI